MVGLHDTLISLKTVAVTLTVLIGYGDYFGYREGQQRGYYKDRFLDSA